MLHTETSPAGRNSDFSAVLHSAGGTVFCKGIAGSEGKRGRMHRHEADINPWLPGAVTPALRWRTEADGWLLLGFDPVPGRHADLAPGSPDLVAVAAVVTALTDELAHCPAEAPRLAEQWARLAAWRRLAVDIPDELDGWAKAHLDLLIDWESRAIELVDGDDLAHTDLHPLNILVGGGGAKVVDWAWSRKANAAVDVAFLIARLIDAGHPAPAAERWAEVVPVWRATPPAARTAFAVAIAGIWAFLQQEQPLAHRAGLTAAARTWARHRLDDVGPGG
ncbi:hypothetical protein L6E12_17135 [Actinokineospora sp. PR83]|uniref:phosphotransferase family protein n=1 Tax=Actinokineospora sp. PR83 TaxID=2884908 RepID=UPI0027E1AABF|nr:hypothetical protein [Actinokineospora sp. PR83]MCG8917510.1 hypothetical protein [Actinokineospora sp. PR83]